MSGDAGPHCNRSRVTLGLEARRRRHWPLDEIYGFLGEIVNGLEPNFAPPAIDAAWAKHLPITIPRTAVNAIKYDGRRSQRFHSAGLLVDETFNARSDPIYFSTIRDELAVEMEVPVIPFGIQCQQNLAKGLHANEITGLKSATDSWCELTGWDLSPPPGERYASPDGLETIVEPPSGATPLFFIRQSSIVIGHVHEAAYYPAELRVTRKIVLRILPRIPPLQGLGEVGYLGGLTGISRSFAWLLTQLPCSPNVVLRAMSD
jgi:hypothetical protein